MAHKPFAVLTDSACDLPLDLARENNIDILSFHITMDGNSYTEREDFTFDEYYDMLRNCKNVPATAHITLPRYLEKFEDYAARGVEEVLYVSINSTGSSTHDAAQMAKREFMAANPQSSMRITIIDSHCYSMAYGWFVVQAAQKLAQDVPMEEVADWLRKTFTQVEIVLAAFSLKFMKKSGRISAAAAFAGELLGLRPIISLNDGVSKVEQKVRGDKDVLPTLLQHAEKRKVDDFYAIGGTNQAVMDELAQLCQQAWGVAPVSTFKLGAAVSTNTGPDAIAIVFLGSPRRQPDAP